jgi:hypothetical protein
VQTLGKIGGDESVAVIEQALFDPENSIRCTAGIALRDAHGPKSTEKILKSIELHGNHMLAEIMRVTLPRIRPLPRAELAAAYTSSTDVRVRQMAMRALVFMPDASLLPAWKKAIDDPDRFTRVAAIRGIGALRNNAEATRQLLAAVQHEDPVMANEASALLGDEIERNDTAARNLRAEILAGLQQRYARFGDAYVDVDREWGYRPVGNAILAFGAEGETVLQSFIDQTNDRQLAIHAWKSLYIRQQPGTFSEVTEKENHEAMRNRPLFLKKPAVPRIYQDFDDREHWTPNTRGMVGDVNHVTARWGALLDEGPLITRDDAFGGGQSLLVRRGGQSFTGQAIPPVHDDADYQLSFQVFRRNEVSALLVRLQGFDGSFQPELALNIADDGSVRLRDMRAETWMDNDLKITPRRWTQIRLLANRRTETYTVSIHTPGEPEQHGSTAAPLTPQPDLRSIVIFPQPPQNSAVLLDRIALAEVQ